MTHNQEVKIQTGALTEGTRHQGDKGIDLEHQALTAGRVQYGAVPRGPARGCPMEVIGARPCRTKVKRREATAAGELAGSSEARFPSRAAGVEAMGWSRRLCVLPQEICRVPRER